MSLEKKWKIENFFIPHFIPPAQVLEDVYIFWSLRGARVLLSTAMKERSLQLSTFSTISLIDLTLWTAEWGRSDFRLLEILLDWLWSHWRELNPIELNSKILKSPTPAIWGVLKEMMLLRQAEMSEAHKAFWILVSENIFPASFRFFLREGKVENFDRSRYRIVHREEIYERWGFIGSDYPSISGWKNLKFSPPESVRLRILRNLLVKEGQINLARYQRELGNKVSRQTAWRDLQKLKRTEVKSRGKTKGRSYVARPILNR